MPRAIADSDDDGDDDILLGNEHVDTNREIPAITIDGLDGANEAGSTGSTERLRRQMLSADKGLMPTAATDDSASSPLDNAKKRRHTAIADAEPTSSPETSMKRVRRVQTYGSRRQRTVLDDEDENDDAIAQPRTSQSARFSEHSGCHSSVELPAGSRAIEHDFVNHEPAVMFRESGSTLEDSASVQQRITEQLSIFKDGLKTSDPELDVALDKPSSSLGWLDGTQQAPAAIDQMGSRQENGKDDGDEDDGRGEIAGHERQERTNEPRSSAGRRKSSEQDNNMNQLQDALVPAAVSARSHDNLTNDQGEMEANPLSQPLTETRRLSPMVEITATTDTTEFSQTDANSGPKSTKGRRRKSQAKEADSEPLNSDDKAIGLPKERYVPRPSRRRATAALEEPIDYSIAPEKAARKKRTRTMPAAEGEAAPEDNELVQTRDTTAEEAPPTDSQNLRHILSALGSTKGSLRGAEKVADFQTAAKTSEAGMDHPLPEVEKQNNQAETAEVAGEQKQTQEDPSSSIAVKPKEEGHIFVKPAMPTPKAKPASGARRSQTTIYEDHVEFLGSQRSTPSLSQQQAKRKSALQAKKEESVGASSRKRRTVIEDEDDEDELAIEEDDDDEEVQPPPKKRGRGRPLKPTAQPKAKSAEFVHDESDGEHESDPEIETDVAPKKAASGRPKKGNNTSRGKENEPVEPVEAARGSQDESIVDQSGPSIMNATALTPQKPQSSAQEIPTPSPEKPAAKESEKPSTTSQNASRTSPTSHTPIKGSSKVPFRVGLSRRHRIPSLLRTMHPPKR